MRLFTANKGKLSGLLPMVFLLGCSYSAQQFYMLEAPVAVTPMPNSNLAKTTQIGLGPIHMPDYLNRPQMVIAVGEHQYRFDDKNRWAEHLEQNVSRVLTQQLAGLLGVEQVLRYPWSQRQLIDYQIVLDILSFHHTAGKGVELKAQWQIRKADQLLKSQQFECQLANSDAPQAIVASQSQCLTELAEQIHKNLLAK